MAAPPQRDAWDRVLATLHGYEQQLAEIGREKAETVALAQELHRGHELLEGNQDPRNRLLSDHRDARSRLAS